MPFFIYNEATFPPFPFFFSLFLFKKLREKIVLWGFFLKKKIGFVSTKVIASRMPFNSYLSCSTQPAFEGSCRHLSLNQLSRPEDTSSPGSQLSTSPVEATWSEAVNLPLTS